MNEQNELILSILIESNKPFLTISQILQKMTKKEAKFFGYDKDLESEPNLKNVNTNIKKYLSDTIISKSKKEKDKFYFLFKKDFSLIVLEYLILYPGKTPKQIAQNSPFTHKEIVDNLTQLLNKNLIRVEFSSIDIVKIYPANLTSQDNIVTKEILKKAFNEIDRGIIFVRICDLRRKLNYPTNFNDLLHDLKKQGIIQLHSGDVNSMNKKDIDDSYIDRNGFLNITITWNLE